MRFICSVVCASLALAQWSSAQEPSRAAELEQARSEKEANLTPDVPSAAERTVVAIQDNPILKSVIGPGDGLRLGFGGMAPTMGFAVGPDWRKTDLWGERIQLNAAFRASTTRSYLGAFSANIPELWDGKAFTSFTFLHRDYSQVSFYGSGADSRKSGRSAYRLEDTSLELRPGLQPVRHLQLGVIGGWYFANVGPGDTSTYISADQQYTPAAAPGIDRQGGFLKSGVFAVYDRRRGIPETVSGFRYEAEWSRMSDLDFGAYSYGRLDIDVQHYFSFFNDRRTIELHGHTALTDTRPNQAVPFYLQPSLGGPDSLRGFHAFRFTGPNAMWMNGEYRWQTSTALDVIFFADAGKVFDRWEQLNVHHLEGSGGFGFQFKTQTSLAFRLDTAFSREGVQVWLRFRNAF